MALTQMIGLDHMVVATHHLDAAATVWSRLGFTISPRGLHSAHLGSANYTVMLESDYVELLGIVSPTDYNVGTREFLARREGLERAAFTARDAGALGDELKSKGISAVGPIDFSRPVDLPGGGQTQARFSTVQWPQNERPGGMRIFACQHLTRDAVWVPELTRHRNTAIRIVRVETVSPDPRGAASQMARLIDQPLQADADGGFVVASGGGRAMFVFLGSDQLRARYPGIDLGPLPDEGAISMCFAVKDLAAAAAASPAKPVGAGRIAVEPALATGVLVAFET